MRYSLLAVALVLAASPAAAQTVDHYDMSRVGNRNADGQAAYPVGVNDPSRVNPPSPATEVAVPLPPPPDTPFRSVPEGVTAGPTIGPLPTGQSTISSPSNQSLPKYPEGFGAPTYAQATQVYPPVVVQPQADSTPNASWYTRVDYFHWNERVDGMDFVNESGALFTLGYQRRIGVERFRAELFGGEVAYEGYGQFSDGSLESMPSNTGYLGLRGEYEFVLAPAAWHDRLAFLAGLGSRFWIRDLHDGTTVAGDPVWGYQETWWTFYPYLGAETHWQLGSELDLYSESRIGATVLTYDFASIGDRPLWPKPGVVANLEVGLRGGRFFIAARGEVMRWEDSSIVQGAYQPRSIMYTLGGRLGFMF
jgi:hypothetical protein